MSIAAGVTFFALLAMFPAIAALVSVYGIFADPGTIRVHLDDLSSILPSGAIEVIGDQLTRDGVAQPAGASGDDVHPVLQSKIHDPYPASSPPNSVRAVFTSPMWLNACGKLPS